MRALSRSDIAALVTTSHDRGMIALVYSMLHAYVNAKAGAGGPVRGKMLNDALALLGAVRDEVIVEHSELHARLVMADEIGETEE